MIRRLKKKKYFQQIVKYHTKGGRLHEFIVAYYSYYLKKEVANESLH